MSLGYPQKFLEENSPDHLTGQQNKRKINGVARCVPQINRLDFLAPSFFCSSVVPPTSFSAFLPLFFFFFFETSYGDLAFLVA